MKEQLPAGTVRIEKWIMSHMRRDYPKEGRRKTTGIVLILFILSVLFFSLAKIIPGHHTHSLKEKMVKASRIMAEATPILNKCRESKGIRPDEKIDINATGFIGLERSPITTTIGSLPAKRTSANPNFAGLIVFLLNECGVREGDIIAVGASASFPALIVAALSAAKAMRVKPLLICSLGASQWGANIPDFHWLTMWSCLEDRLLLNASPLAVSVGGERDVGEDMIEKARVFLRGEIRSSGYHFLSEPDLVRNVRSRMELFSREAGGKEIKAFVNIGGSWVNLGIDSSVLSVKPGLSRIDKLPRLERWGIMYAMAAERIPVVHLLYVRGLAQTYGLPWDPVPLPQPGEGRLYETIREKQVSFVLIAALYLFLVVVVIIFWKKSLIVL